MRAWGNVCASCQVPATINDRDRMNPWLDRCNVPEDIVGALPSDAQVMKGAMSRLKLVAQTPQPAAESPPATSSEPVPKKRPRPKKQRSDDGETSASSHQWQKIRVIIASFGHFQRTPPRGHIAVDVQDLQRGYGYKRAPGGGIRSSGLNAQVRAQIGASAEYQKMLSQIYDCAIDLVKAGKQEIFVGIGCKWGKHRSVAMVCDLHNWLVESEALFDVDMIHLERFRWDRNCRRGDISLGWDEKTAFSFTAGA